MRMTATERGFAPEAVEYLRDSFSKLANNSRIVNNLMVCGSMTQQQARRALRWKTNPIVFFQPLCNHKCANSVGDAKCAFNAANNCIEVNSDWLDAWDTTGGLLSTPSGLLVPNIGVAMLHALCHWGNFKAKVKETAEMGFEFERMTYGTTF